MSDRAYLSSIGLHRLNVLLMKSRPPAVESTGNKQVETSPMKTMAWKTTPKNTKQTNKQNKAHTKNIYIKNHKKNRKHMPRLRTTSTCWYWVKKQVGQNCSYWVKDRLDRIAHTEWKDRLDRTDSIEWEVKLDRIASTAWEDKLVLRKKKKKKKKKREKEEGRKRKRKKEKDSKVHSNFFTPLSEAIHTGKYCTMAGQCQYLKPALIMWSSKI